MDRFDVGISAHVLYGSFSCIVWFIRKVLGHKRASSFSLGVLIALHAGLIYRMDFAVNLYMSDPDCGEFLYSSGYGPWVGFCCQGG